MKGGNVSQCVHSPWTLKIGYTKKNQKS